MQITMKEKPSALAAHAMALFTIIVWGTTFIASKLLLDWYTPLQVMLWGFLTAMPMALVEGGGFALSPLADGTLLFCVLFLGVIGSGICYVLWNIASRRLGIVVVNNYIYVNPFATMVAAGLVLREPISWMGIVGAVLILLGVFVSDRKVKKKEAIT